MLDVARGVPKIVCMCVCVFIETIEAPNSKQKLQLLTKKFSSRNGNIN